jgi:hypothetical protein
MKVTNDEHTVDYLKARVVALEKRNEMLQNELNLMIRTISSFCESMSKR